MKVNGKDFNCGFDVEHGGIVEGEEVLGCPECKEVDNLEVACSIPYCPHKAFALNGKWYCHEHYAISKLIKVNKLRG